MTDTEVSETLVLYPVLTQLVAKEDFKQFSHHESFKLYVKMIFMEEQNLQEGIIKTPITPKELESA
jgi:hypothetical protein